METTTEKKPKKGLSITQSIRKKYKSEFEIAVAYFDIFGIVNRLPITSKEVKLLAYLAINGNSATKEVRENYMKEHKTSKAALYNMTSKLKRMKLIVKNDNKKLSVNPIIVPDFKKNPFTVLITLDNIGVS